MPRKEDVMFTIFCDHLNVLAKATGTLRTLQRKFLPNLVTLATRKHSFAGVLRGNEIITTHYPLGTWDECDAIQIGGKPSSAFVKSREEFLVRLNTPLYAEKPPSTIATVDKGDTLVILGNLLGLTGVVMTCQIQKFLEGEDVYSDRHIEDDRQDAFDYHINGSPVFINDDGQFNLIGLVYACVPDSDGKGNSNILIVPARMD